MKEKSALIIALPFNQRAMPSKDLVVEQEEVKVKRKRNVLLDAESENLLLQIEREEFKKVLQEQFSHVDINTLGTLPECQNVKDMHLPNDNSWLYWMSVVLQYQSFRSYPHYSTDEENQLKQVEWQKEMRFQLMQKKRAIKREKRKILKIQKKIGSNSKGSAQEMKTKRSRSDIYEGTDTHANKRIKMDISIDTQRNNDESFAFSNAEDEKLMPASAIADFLLPSPFSTKTPVTFSAIFA